MLSPKDFIEIFPVFTKGPDRLITDLLSAGRMGVLEENRLLLSEGDECSSVPFLLSGEIRVYKTGDTGREITLYEVEKGDICILNPVCALTNTLYPANAVAVHESKALFVPAAEFRRSATTYEVMRDFVLSLVLKRFISVVTLIEEVTFGRMDERLIKYLEEKAQDGMLQVTHQKISDDLGTSREVITRLLNEFERKGKVALSRNMIHLIHP